MISQLAYYLIFGKPLIIYSGVLTLFLFFLATLIAVLNKKGVTCLPFVWHQRFAKITLTLAIIHGLLGLSIYLNF